MNLDIEFLITALRNLKRQGIRTFLTLIGIIIGVSSIVALLSIGAGLNVALDKQFEAFGTNMIILYPGSITSTRQTFSITDSDIRKVESINGVEDTVSIYVTSGIMEFNNVRKKVTIMGADAKDSKLFDEMGFFAVDEGTRPETNVSDSIMIGSGIAKDYFDKPINLRKNIKINNLNYTVSAILEPQQQALGDPESGNTVVFMTTEGYKRLTGEENPSPVQVIIKIRNPDDSEEIIEKIKDYFENKYGEGSVFVSSAEQVQEMVNQVYSLITLVLTGIAGISIIVGGIGIANAMIASVMERTKEIGLMKALGAPDIEILLMFVLEAGLIGGIGGIIGIIFGYTLAGTISFVGQAAGFMLESPITWEVTLGALIFSILIGMIFGYFPAKKAADMDPVDAIRYS